MTMNIFKYQGQALTGGAVGETVEWEGLSWTVTEQGHLVAQITEESAMRSLQLVASGMAQLEPPAVESHEGSEPQ